MIGERTDHSARRQVPTDGHPRFWLDGLTRMSDPTGQAVPHAIEVSASDPARGPVIESGRFTPRCRVGSFCSRRGSFLFPSGLQSRRASRSGHHGLALVVRTRSNPECPSAGCSLLVRSGRRPAPWSQPSGSIRYDVSPRSPDWRTRGKPRRHASLLQGVAQRVAAAG
jgi:hypothetical protein